MATHSHEMRRSGHSGPRRPGRKARARLEARRKDYDENWASERGFHRPGSLQK